jgi:hypothetical protein
MTADLKLRWRIERDLNQEVGLGHFEGRGRRGFHPHATPCIAAYGFGVPETVATKILRKLLFPKIIDQGDPQLRPGMAPPNSIATTRRRLRAALVSNYLDALVASGQSQVKVAIEIL